MLFNSGTFLQFFAAFILLYYAVRNHRTARNVLIVLASYLFYGWWDYRFLALLLVSSLLDYSVGLALDRLATARSRRQLLTLSVLGNLGILGFFKYYDFFANSLNDLLQRFGLGAHLATLSIVLPVGISFYTFQTMSYALDVYRRQIPATRNLLEFLAFVSFFPQLVAGPIERAKHLLPQFREVRAVTEPFLAEGIWLCLWGMFKKVVLADNLAPLVELAYNRSHPEALLAVLGTLAFGLQIYCDFSGYSDIARGTARLLGFDIMLNFDLPYFATSPREFWRRWHISLSTWLRDYLYFSLGGSRAGAWRTYRNLFVTMLLGGLWHGAAWNFVAWGAWHGGGLALHRFWAGRRERRTADRKARSVPEAIIQPEPALALVGAATCARLEEPSIVEPATANPTSAPGTGQPVRARAHWVAWAGTMAFVFYGWLLFRAGSWHKIVALTGSMANWTLPAWWRSYCLNLVVFTAPLAAMQIWQARTGDLLVPLRLGPWRRGLLEGVLLVGIILFWEKAHVPFIYFQF